MVKIKIRLSQFFLERPILAHKKILVYSCSFVNFISVNCFEDCCLNFNNIGCFLMYNYFKFFSFNHNCHKKNKKDDSFVCCYDMNKSTYCSNAYWNFLGCYRYIFALLYKTKAVISAYEIKFQFICTNLYISKYTSQHIA